MGVGTNGNGLANRHVLVVEDELLIRWSIVETLVKAGCTVTEAEDAATAVKAIEESDDPIDAVVLDFRLPDSDDLGLLARIRQLSPASAVVMMTAFGTPEVRQGASALGVYSVIDKPFEMNDLEHTLAEACAARTSRRAAAGRSIGSGRPLATAGRSLAQPRRIPHRCGKFPRPVILLRCDRDNSGRRR